jgi:hypothetical protein
MAMNLLPVAIGVLLALMALAAVAVVVVFAMRRRSSSNWPSADYDDAPPRA